MEHRYLKMIAALFGALPVTALTLMLSVGAAMVVPASVARAAGGQCKWEGGPGAAGGPSYAYCKAEDCKGRGGLAECSVGVPAVMYPFLDSQVYQDKWVYGYDNGFS